ncbi:MAG: ribonuclease H-like domain-containing protein [Patescibacteria group bacterium]|nr:ribonuclease H-like domain-containing protein [Patescibacteria group bacterium]
MSKLFLDIETIPADPKLWPTLEKDIQAKHELKKKKPYKKEDVYRKTALNGSYGRILCIGYLKEPNMEKPAVLTGPEKEILTKFWQLSRGVQQFIGHNVMDFDLQFIYKRSIINRVRPSQWLNFARYRNNPIYDTMREWEKWNMSSSISLDMLAKILDLPSSKSGDLDGSKVYDFYKKGKLKEIYKYCQADVEVTRAIYKKMTFTD